MSLDLLANRPKLTVTHAEILRQLDRRLKPELRFTVRSLNVNVRAIFFAREEIPSSRKSVGLTVTEKKR